MHARAVALLTGVVMTLSAMPLVAHHSWNTVFSEDKPLVLRGTLIKVELVNPHGWIWIEVKAPDGTITKWGIEGGPPNGLSGTASPRIRSRWEKSSSCEATARAMDRTCSPA